MKRQQKLDCQKIKELILNEIIDINSLQENELEILIDFEEENIIKCDIEYDMTFLNKCMVALKKFQNYENMFSEQNMETISNSAYQQYVSKFSNNSITPTLNTKKNIPMKKMIRICVSVGALILLITITTIACWNPFSKWIDSIYDLFEVKQGEILTENNSDLSIDNQGRIFKTVSDLEATLNINLRLLKNIPYQPDKIELITMGNASYVDIRYTIDQTPLMLKIYLKNAPYNKEYLLNSQYEREFINNIEWVLISQDNFQAITFYEEYVCVALTNTSDDLIKFFKGEYNEKN